MKFKVVFTYDEATKTWSPTVLGAKDAEEARHGFSAIVLTCMQLRPDLLEHAQVNATECGYEIIPAV